MRLLWEITGRLLLLSDAHVGAARSAPRHTAGGDADLQLDRDPGSGLPRLRAGTLAGLLRHELAARTADPDRARELFGAAASDTGARPASALHLDDALARIPGEAPAEVRTATRVDPASATVRPGRTWREEILPAGTEFDVHLRLHVPAPADEARLLTLLLLAAGGLTGAGPGIRVGARTGRGHGTVRATRWRVRRHDLADEHDWFAYHARTWEERWREGSEELADAPADLADALVRQLRGHGRTAIAAHVLARSRQPDRRHRAELHLTLEAAERTDPLSPPPGGTRPGLLAGGALSGERLGGTALFSLFKRIGARLARDTAEQLADGGEPASWRDWHDRWWGADTDPRTARPRPSRIRLRAAPALTGGTRLTATRLTVDPLFGDAVEGRVFTGDLLCGGRAEAVLDVDGPEEAVYGLLTLLVRELATVPLDALGAATGSGNGRLTAVRAVLAVYSGADGPPRTVDLLAALFDPHGPEAAAAHGWLACLHARLAPGGAEGEEHG